LIDPRSFTAQARWKRAVILVAGAFMNLVFGVIILFILALTIKTGEISSAKLAYVYPQSTFADLIQEGDKIRSVNGHRVFYYSDFSMFLALPESADGVIDLVISRGGEKIRYGDLKLERTYIEELGGEYFGFVFENTEMTFGEKLKYTAYSTYNDVRLIGMSLQMLFTGQASLRDLSGPVGIVEIINEQGQKEHTTASGETYVVPLSVRLYNVFSLAALIAVNLAVMNLLPLPGLDGGRVAGLIITFCVEKIIRRKLNPKYEGYVHAAGLILLLGLMAFVLVSDVLKIVR
ncbi:MAG: M50 family metallopeptidase, partial [Oscillospiraceae bacterium]|nr:M50 family metallopeptidase [Oscillospiraceae bacterium]